MTAREWDPVLQLIEKVNPGVRSSISDESLESADRIPLPVTALSYGEVFMTASLAE